LGEKDLFSDHLKERATTERKREGRRSDGREFDLLGPGERASEREEREQKRFLYLTFSVQRKRRGKWDDLLY